MRGRAEWRSRMRAVTKATARWVRGALAGAAVLAVAGDKEADESPLDKETYQAVMAGEAREPGDLLARYKLRSGRCRAFRQWNTRAHDLREPHWYCFHFEHKPAQDDSA